MGLAGLPWLPFYTISRDVGLPPPVFPLCVNNPVLFVNEVYKQSPSTRFLKQHTFILLHYPLFLKSSMISLYDVTIVQYSDFKR